MSERHETRIRVRYHETDPMGFVHHSNYLNYFELARIEMLRSAGGDYRQMEAEGLLVVVVKVECRYRKPARFDDELLIQTEVTRITPAKIEHRYHVLRGADVLAEAKVTLAVVDRDGNVQRVPSWLFQK